MKFPDAIYLAKIFSIIIIIESIGLQMNRVIKSMTRVARMPTMRAIALFSTKNMFKASSTSPLFSRNTLMFSTGSGSPFENV